MKLMLLAMGICMCLSMRAQTYKEITVSGIVKDSLKKNIEAATVSLYKYADSSLVAINSTDENGRFQFAAITPAQYWIEISSVTHNSLFTAIRIGELSSYIDLGAYELSFKTNTLEAVVVSGRNATLSDNMEKKTFSLAGNLSQSGGSVLQSLKNLPGITVDAEGKLQLRGSDKVMVLIDGKQTAITGFGNQQGLDNLPASAIEKIEIINNPSAKFDANGNAGIINIIYKKNKQEGFNGKLGITAGLGALWEREPNLPGIRPQYTQTPKVNPSLSLNYRRKNINSFLQADNLYTQTLNKNEFVHRVYDNGSTIEQQLKRNRNTNFFTSRAGIDWQMNSKDQLSISGMFGSEKIIDRGDQPFFDASSKERLRLWQFLEDELKTTVMGTATYLHQFPQAGRKLQIGYNYTFHREDEKYFFTNIMPDFTGEDAFALISDEHVSDVNIDYTQPLRYGRWEAGAKFRYRNIPTDMTFIPGINSPLDVTAGGWATYSEIIPALYSNYVYETGKIETELGIRLEYVDLKYRVNPDHNTYKSDGYNYTQPFPTVRVAYKFNDNQKISLFYNRRVDRPNEVDIRIFPKYDDAEIIKVGNPALRPQFTNSIELGYKTNWSSQTLYAALYHRFANATITRISSIVPGSNLIYAIFQNAGKSYQSGIEAIWNQQVSKLYNFNVNLNGYQNQINAFSVTNLYPEEHIFTAAKQKIISGNAKWNNNFRFSKGTEAQVSVVYLAPDIIPQGKIKGRFSIDAGAKKIIQKGKGELFVNVTDLLNTMVIEREIQGMGFSYTSKDYYETQVLRIGYSYKF